MVAEQIGAFKAAGLDVKIVPPSDPALPPRLVAAKQADLAITLSAAAAFLRRSGPAADARRHADQHAVEYGDRAG